MSQGVVTKPGRYSVEETVERVTQILTAKGITLFALVDHSAEAEKAGMQMPPTKLLIFGNPKAGTPLLVDRPSVALDLPLKLLVRQDAEGEVWVSYNSAEYLQERHGLSAGMTSTLAAVEALATQIVRA
ncbi:MAG: DUF302 domain-containing protein [Acidobacteriaceae bacterium]|nr:DUF302 domain-containing protein [Acidobacteriaceae bacterium]